jgi:TRAP-type C4-dicarboxylate transport system permease small subunit
MTPTSSPLGGIEQVLLLLFMLMVLVGIAGGNPSMVLNPVFDIVGQMVRALLSLLSTLLITLFRVLGNVLVSGINLLAETLKNGSGRQNKR